MQYIILLRGINVGGRTIKMAELKTCFENASYQNVQTVLQTGNVILESNESNVGKLQKQLEDLLSTTFTYAAKVLVITANQLKSILQQSPFQVVNPAFHSYIIFTENDFEKELVKNCGVLDKNIEEVQSGKNVVYWRVLKGNTFDSSFGKHIGKAASKHFITNRNKNTLEKIMAKCK